MSLTERKAWKKLRQHAVDTGNLHLANLFGDDARRLYEWMQQHGYDLALLKYGFQFRRSEVHEELVHDRIETVRERVLENARREGNPLHAVIEGVDDAWEISVLRFTFEMVRESHGINVFDFKRKGLL